MFGELFLKKRRSDFEILRNKDARKLFEFVTTSKSAPCASRGECYSCFNADVEIVPNSLEKN